MAQSPLLPRVTLSAPDASNACPPCACGGQPRCLCTCQFPREPLFVLCENCFPNHLKTLANHNYLEIAAYEFVRGMEDLKELRRRNVYRSEMQESLRKIEACRKEVEASVTHIVQFLNEHKAKICEKLDECVSKVNEGLSLIDKMQYSSAQTFHFPYRNVTFTYSINLTDVTEEIEKLCRFDIGNSREMKQLCSTEEADAESSAKPWTTQVKTEEAEQYPQKRKGGAMHLPKKRKAGPEQSEEELEDRTEEMDVLVVNFTP